MSKRTLYFISLVLGVFLVIVTEFQDTPDLILQIGGFCLLMLALYQLSKGVKDMPTKDSYVENEEEE
ncbi:MAG: hypothetical protein P8P13_03180 [Flavobacteriaceae bacterium]|jgi:uncharacterized membrane protein|nr:hypothetical protein [Flavobacteriaceae bacterium]MDA7848717.1 hypothetical protein [Flavobacteriaceae bacterium]MDG1309482.1 hypothetical protein [Flavobacteriaceae bacterium]